MSVRPAAVSGLFYDDDPARLQRHVADLLAACPAPGPAPRALIVPHAGYIYSGATAALAYRQLAPLRHSIRRVALFGPAHRVYLRGMALPSVDSFATPLGEVSLDTVAMGNIARLADVTVDDEPHAQEHSLEVQLPFLQTVLEYFTLVPVVVGDCPPQTVAQVMDLLAEGPGTLLVISTDLSHFHNYEQAEQLDARTCDRILARDSGLHGKEACGARVLNGLLSSDFCADLDMELLGKCNSGDTAGDRQRVVGYGAFSLH